MTSTGSACGAGGGAESGWRGDAFFVALSTSTNQVGIGATSTQAKFFVQSTSVGTTTAIFQGMTAQTADLFQVASSSGAIYFQISNLGVASSTELRAASTTAGTLRATGNVTFDSHLAIGTTTFTGSISIQSSTAAASGVAGIFQQLVINPTTGGNFQFGERTIVMVSSTASTTAIGSFIRTIDNTSLANTVHALQVQAWSGTNNQGENTGIFGAGRTFGVKGITSGEAGGVAEPAGVLAELRNGTQGNALRAYSSTSTTATLIQAFQEASVFSGTGFLMNFGNGGGSFTGNFLNLQRASTTKFNINASGTVVIASSSAAAGASSTLTVCALTNCVLPTATSTGSVIRVASVDGTTGTNSIVALGTIAGNAADFGEYVPIVGQKSDYEAGDVLSVASSTETFEKSAEPYDPKLAGAITVSAAFVGGLDGGIENKVVMALAGRIPVKVSGEGGPIAVGDPITSASLAGHGMKAESQGRVLGMALEAWNPTSTASTGKILILINPHWYVPKVSVESLQGSKKGTGSVLNTFTFDDSKVYHIENLTTQNLEIGSKDKPTGFTLYDTVTKSPYCITIENGNIRTSPGKCAGSTTLTTGGAPTGDVAGASTATDSGTVTTASPPAETSTDTTTSTTTPTSTTVEVSTSTTEESAPPAETTTTTTTATSDTTTTTSTDTQPPADATTTDATAPADTTTSDTSVTTEPAPSEPAPAPVEPSPDQTTTQ